MIKQVEAKRSAKAKHKQVFILTDLANNIKQQVCVRRVCQALYPPGWGKGCHAVRLACCWQAAAGAAPRCATPPADLLCSGAHALLLHSSCCWLTRSCASPPHPQTHAPSQAKQVEGLVAKEAQEAETAAAAPLTSLNRKLEGKWKAITALQVGARYAYHCTPWLPWGAAAATSFLSSIHAYECNIMAASCARSTR